MTKLNPNLDRALSELSEVQSDAVRWETGALLVLAGPGSGKTRVLTTRIARLLAQGADERFRILALTFTNRAADEMRERVIQLVPEESNRLFIGTFHSFCTEILRQNGQHLQIPSDYRIYSSDEDRNQVALEAIRSDEGRNVGLQHDDAKMLALVDRAKAMLFSPEGSKKYFKDQERGEKFEAFYRLYEKKMINDFKALDFNSLLYYSNKLFEKYPKLTSKYRLSYKYWFVDEFQDTNYAQFNILKLLSGNQFDNIFAVADDDQIIYQWNGADYHRIEEFKSTYGAEVIQIPDNFRCPADVVRLANSLIRHNLLRTTDKKPLVARKDTVSPDSSDVIRLLSFSDEPEEAKSIAADIQSLRAKELDNTVVLARAKKLLQPVLDELNRLDVNAKIAQRRDQFISSPFIWIDTCLKQALNRNDERLLETFIGSFNDMFDTEVPADEVASMAKASHGDMLRAAIEFLGESESASPANDLIKITKERLLDGVDIKGFSTEAISFFESLRDGAGDEVDGRKVVSAFDEDKAAWHALFSEVSNSIRGTLTLEVFLQELELRSKEPPRPKNTVSLMTIHSAKGNEFDHVYIIGLAEDVLPSYFSKKKGDTGPDIEEERRNCFVAITRAMKTLTLSYASRYNGWHKEPSRFLHEMGLTE